MSHLDGGIALTPQTGVDVTKPSGRKRPRSREAGPGHHAVAAGDTAPSLRTFSLKVSQAVESIGTTTYQEVADTLVVELLGDRPNDSARVSEERNVRRRVYDALNVLEAMAIITKEKKTVRWVGFPDTHAAVYSMRQRRADQAKQIAAKELKLRALIGQLVSRDRLIRRNSAAAATTPSSLTMVASTSASSPIERAHSRSGKGRSCDDDYLTAAPRSPHGASAQPVPASATSRLVWPDVAPGAAAAVTCSESTESSVAEATCGLDLTPTPAALAATGLAALSAPADTLSHGAVEGDAAATVDSAARVSPANRAVTARAHARAARPELHGAPSPTRVIEALPQRISMPFLLLATQ